LSLRIFARDASIYAAGNIGLRAAALLLTPVYTHFLTIPEFGLWAALQVAMQMMVIPMNMGMREAFVRFTMQHENTRSLDKLLGTTALIILAGGVLVTGISETILLPLFRAVLHRDQLHGLIALTCSGALAHALCVHTMTYYRARNLALRYLATGMGGAFALLASTIGSMAIFGPNVEAVLYAYIFSYALTALLVLLDIWRTTGIGFSREVIPQAFRFGAPLVFSAVGQFAITGASTFLLSYFSGLEVVAIFSLGYKLAGVLTITVVLPFQLAFQPFLFASLNDPDIRRQTARLFTYLLLVLAYMSFAIILTSHMLLPYIAPPQYADAFLVVLLIIPAQALLGVHYFAETLLGAVERTSILALLNSLCALLSIVLSVLLIPSLHWYGAVIASNVSLLLVCTLEVTIAVRLFKIGCELECRRIAIVATMFCVFLGVLYLLSALGRPWFYFSAMALLAISSAILYWGPFCHDAEQRLVVDSARRIYARIRMRTSTP